MNRFQAWYRVQPRALRALLTINVVVYVLWLVVFIHIEATRAFVWGHLALNPGLPGILFEPWQLLTYNFLHLQPGFWGLLHIGFNMLWLYWIGKEYEELHGAHRLLAVYLIAGLGGGLMTVLLHALLPGVGAFGGVVHGASASVLGVITMVAITYPYKSIALLFIGTVRLIYVVIGFLALDLLFIAGGGTSVSAHLGGALFGFLFAKAEASGRDLSSWAGVFFPSRRRPSRRAPERGGLLGELESFLSTRRGKDTPPPSAGGPGPFRSQAPEVVVDDNPLQGKIDRILDKISEEGIESLSEEERRLLDDASRR